MSEPTVAALTEILHDLTDNWKLFALYLPKITQSDIETITYENQNLATQKIALYNKWLHVYPKASWDDVVKALENLAVKENTIGQRVREKFYEQKSDEVIHSPPPSSVAAMSPGSQSSTDHEVHREEVSEEVVKELNTLHESFVGLVGQVQTDVESEVEKGKLRIKAVTRNLQEERAFPIPSLKSVQTTDELFTAIHPHYHFLNCYLIVSIALRFLSGVIAEKATEYEDKVVQFMKTTKIRYLRNALKRYVTTRPPSTTKVVKIVVHDFWNQQSLWLVKMLLKTLFPVKHPDELPWYDIVDGSVIMTFIALEHMTSSLIESSRKKTEFMRLIGVISLKIGDELFLPAAKRKDGDAVLSFEDSLIRATLADYIEAVQFILQYTQPRVDINTRNTNRTLIVYDENMFLEPAIENLLKSYHTISVKLLKDIEYELHQLMEEGTASVDDDTIASIWHPSSNFMNYTSLVSISHLLPEDLAIRVKKYNGTLENLMKKRSELTSFETNLDKYFPTPFPGSIEVIITLHSVWSICSVWYVEQLGQLIFTPTLFYQLQWFRVDRREESVRVCLLADGKIMNSLKECVSANESRTSMLGVVSIQVDDTVMITNHYSDGYTFHEAIELAKAIGDDDMSEIIQQMLLSPKDYEEVSEVDDNNNVYFSPDPDSTPLMIACCNDNSELVQLLLDHNADPNKGNRRESTALIYSTGNSKIFQMLLDHGADINTTNFIDYTTLHFASWVGNFQVVDIILNKSSELVNALSCNYRTPLAIACRYRHLEIVKRLLEAKANPNVRDNEGMTSLLLASMNGDTEIVETLLLANADPNSQDNEGKTPLISATEHYRTDIVEKLLKANADTDIKSNDGQTALMVACTNSYIEIAELLLEAGADPDLKNNKAAGQTALDLASKTGNRYFIKRLCRALDAYE